MEKRNKLWKWGMVLALALFLLIPGGSSAEAKTKKVTAVTNFKKAPSLQLGNNRLTVKKEDSYAYFKAPKKGIYKVTFFHLAGLTKKYEKKTVAGFTSYVYDKKLKYIQGKHKGIKDSGFVFASSWLIENKEEYQSGGWVDTCTVYYSLKKGQKIFFMMYGKPENRFRTGVKIVKK